MKPVFRNNTVVARCPGCGGRPASYVDKIPSNFGQAGNVILNGQFNYEGKPYRRVIFRLLRCSTCGRGGLSTVYDTGQTHDSTLADFYPTIPICADLPENAPAEVLREFREAELCAAHGAWRAASAMLRSALEKSLKLNGYNKGNLKEKIDAACSDGVITEARKTKAHQEVRVLGNDILHDAWREVTEEEFGLAHHYTHRILEDFYDNRLDVESILKEKGRIQ